MADFNPVFDKMIYNEGGFKLIDIAADRGGQTYAGLLGIAGLRSFDKLKRTDTAQVGAPKTVN
jgi:hypothetical protein